MLNGFRRGTSPGRPLANLFSFGEGVARIRAEQRKAALRRSSILSSRLSVEALEPRLLLSADVAPIDVGLGLGLPSGLVASMEPSAKFLTVMPFDGAGAGTGIGGIAPGIDMSALSVRVGGYALDVDGADTASGFYAHGGSGGSGSAGAPGTTAALTTFGGADGEGEGISLLSLSAPTAVPPVTGSLDVPGATQSFTFTLTEARKVYFDSLTDRSNIRWSLVGPNGTLVNGRAFGASDSIDISGSNILDLAAGDYRLTVDGDGDATGAFAFRLLDIASAAPIQAGALVSAQNEGRATDLYAFDAVAGERYFFDRQTLTGGTVSWRLIGPDGEYVRGPDYYNDSGVFALDRTGTYTLAIEGVDSNSAAFDYGFILSRVTATEAALVPGELVRGRIEGAGDTITYIFDLAGETRLLFDALRDDRGFQWSLAGPRGTVVDGRYFWNSEGSSGQPLLALPAGRYRLTVGGGGSDARGDFAFRLLDAGAAQDVTALPGFGGAVGDGGVSDAIGRGGGAPLDYSGLPGTVNHGWDVNRQKDLIVADSDALRPATLTLEAWVRSAEAVDDGDGGIIIFGGDPYQTILFKGSSTSWDDGYGLLRIGDTVRFYLNDWYDAYIEAPIESERWVHVAATYDGAVMRLYVDGLQVAERDFAEAIRHSGAPLVIGGGPQAYYPWNGAIDEVRVWDVARSAAQIAAAAQAPLSGGESGLVGYWRFDEADGWAAADSSPSGSPATGGAPATETRLYSFAAAKGEHWYFDVASQSGASLTVRVYRPDGTQLVAPAALADLNLANLPMDGTYLIAVEGVVGNGGAAAFSARMVKVADPTRAIAVDTLVTGRREPGERHTLTFTLTQPARLLFDSLTSRWDLHWTLTGPRGAEVNQRAFAYSDSLDLSSGLSSLLDLPAGTYSLIVDGSVGEAVDYAFRLIDTANAQAVAFDADVTGSFATGGTSNVYRFDASAGDKVTLERLIDATSSDYSIGWRLFDPFGRQVTNANYLHGTSTVDLRVTGTYTLAIEQRVGAAPIGYGFRVNLTEHVALPDISGGALFQPGDTLSGTLVAGGEPGLHRFTVAGPTRLTFDSLTNDSGKTWTLLGPNGVEVTARSFSASDGTGISGSAVIDLPAGGTYQLRVSGTAGAYSMRLLDLAAATPITPGGALVESRLLPSRATDMYSFTGVAGETLYLDTQTALSSGSFRLIDPFGRLVVGPVGFADRELALPVDGTYVLLIEGRVANTAADDDYSFILNRPRDPAPLDLTLGARIDGVLAAAGDVQRYRFQLSSERLLALDSFTGSTTLTWRLKGPGIDYSASLRDADGAFQGTRPPLMLAAGDYELLIDGTGAAVGPYAFRLLDLAATATLLAADGATIAGALAPSSETDVYALDLTAGETIVFDAQTVPASSTIRLVDSFGNEVTGALTFADRTLVAAVTGRHYLLVEGRATNTAESSAYSFALIRPVDPAPRAIALGETVSTAIARPTEVNRFTFTLTETTRVIFDSLTNDSTIRWALRGATGTVSSADFYYSDSSEAPGERVLTLAPGSYEIAVQADGYRTSSASFRLLDLADAAPLALGQSVSGRLEPSSETDMYRFDAAAGERYYFQNLLGIGNATIRVIRPDGTQTRTPAGVADYEFTADQAGTYVVMIEGRVWDATARDYRFALHRATTAATAIALDGNVEQPSLLRPGKIGNALSMTTHEQILVDDPALDLREDLTIEFWLNPERMTDSWTPLIYKGEGTDGRGYTLWYNSSGYVHLSSYRGTANDTLETASGSVPQGQWTHVAAVIERSTGQMRIYLNGVLVASRTNVPTAPHNGSAASPLYIGTGPEQNDSYQKLEGAIDELRIWDHGRSAEEILAGMDGVPSDTGGLVLRMDFDAITGGTVRNQVSGADVPVLRDLAGLDGVIEGRLTTPGDTRTYSFTVAEPKMLLFDALHDNSQMTVTITGPGGVSAARNMRNGESHEYGSGNPLIEVGPGTYTVTVDGTGAATGAYAFRLIDVGAAPVLPQGSVATGRSSGSRDNAVWRIDAAAGDRLFIDLQQFGGSLGRASFRLFDPFGRQISGPVQVGDIDTGVLAYGGTYTLVMEMRAAVVNWPVDYRVAVYNMAQTAPVPITLEGPNPDAPTVVAGVDGNALKLRGVDYVELPDGPDVDLTRNLTIEGWFFLDRFTSSWMPVVSKGLGDIAPYRLAVNSSGQIWATVRDASGREDVTSASGVVPTGEWVHMAMVVDRDNRTLKLYVNGQEVASRQIRLNDNVDVADPFYIGHYDDETIYAPIEGAVDSFRLWGLARSAAEVAADMASAPAAGTPDLKIALDFDSTSLPTGALLRSTNPNGVTGRIATPGAENRYSFTLTQTTLALFDSLTNNSRLRWSLTGPDGDLIVDGRRFDQSDSFTFTGNPVLALAAGRYELTIDGIDDAVADYNFRLLDLANAAPLAMGSRVTASLTPSNATAIHRFSANAGESFFFDVLSVKSDVRWRLIDPNGNIVFNQQSMADIDGQLLALSGTYTLLIEGRIDQGLAAAYDFIIYPMAVQTAPLTIGAQISSTISQPGERDVYSFTLTERTRLVFDSLLYQGELNWSLAGPDGQIVSARRFDQSDGLNFTGSPVLDLAAGAYTLTIDGNRQFTGAYAFRLLDLAAAELLVANQGTTGNLGPQGRETAAYRFEATEGMRFGIDVLNSPNYNHRLRLIDPLGQVVFGPTSMQDSGLMTAAMAGTYTVLVEGYAAEGSNFSYSFLLDVAAQPPANGATGQDFDADGLPYVLVNHQGAAAQVLRDGENDFLRLTDALNSNPHNSVFFSATGSGRQDVVDVGFDFRIERRAGQATDPDGIAFAWLPVALYGAGGPGPTIPRSGSSGLEPNVAGALGIGFDSFANNGEVNANHVSIHYNGVKLTDIASPGLTLASGDWTHARILMTRTAGGTLLTIRLTAEGGAAIEVVTDYFIPGMELEAGRVALSASQGTSTGDQDVDNIAVAMTSAATAMPAVPFGEAVTGSIARTGAVERYSFTITQPTAVVFDPLTNNSNFRWQISGPSQTPAARQFTASDSLNFSDNPVMLLQPGTYSLAISAGTATGSYAFRLLDLAQAAALTPGEQQSVTLNPGNMTQLFHFDGTAGERLFFDYMSGATLPYWRLIDPRGNTVFTPRSIGSDSQVELTETGRYTLMVEGRIANAEPQTTAFRLVSMTDRDAALTVGATTQGTVPLPGDRMRYSFSLAQDALLLFDSLTGNGNFRWSLTGPQGTTIQDRTFANSDSQSRTDATPFLAAAGDYVLTVWANNDVTGDYAFRLLDLASASAIALDTVIDGLLEPANSTGLYNFVGEAGDKLFFDYLSSGPTGRWRLIDPQGRQIVYNNTGASSDMGPVVLTRSGTYTLVVEGHVTVAGASAPVQFKVSKLVDKVAPLTLGATHSGTFAQPQQEDVYRFTLAEGTLLLVDPLTSDGSLVWTLTGPRSEVASKGFQSSDGASVGAANPVLVVPAGDYELRVRNNSTTARDYALRVLDLAAATPITPGLAVTGTLSPGSETEAFRFEGEAGERYYFDRQALSGGSAYWRLIAPNGRQLFSGYFNDVDSYVLPDTGTYTLLLEGYIGDVGSVYTYGFNVFENPETAPIPIPGLEVRPAPDLIPQGVTVSGEGAIQSGGTITVAWQTRNDGTLPATGTWSDRLILRNLDTGQIIGNFVIADNGGDLAPGASRQRQTTVSLPTGNAGVGRIVAIVTTDIANAVAEENASGSAETNNEASVEFQSILAPFIDLSVGQVAVEPVSGWKPGDTVTINWTTTNSGNRPTAGAFSERIVVRNASSGQQVLLATVAAAPIDAGASRSGSYSIVWPEGLIGHGQFTFTVTTDILDQVAEANDAGTGESNNAAALTITSAPDLVIRDMAIDATAPQAGDSITLSWTEANIGNAATLAGWNNRVLVQNITTGETLLDTAVASDMLLAAGTERARSFTFKLPDGARSVGSIRVTLYADQNAGGGGNAVREVADGRNAEGNNSAQLTMPVAARVYADLRVGDVGAPPTAIGGGTMTVSWRVDNAGASASAEGGWVDRVILSADAVLGNGDDIVIGEYRRTDPLAEGGSYTASLDIALPSDIGGLYRLFVVTDAGQAVVEPDTRADNASAPVEIQISSTAPNLVADAVSGPAGTVFGGDPFTVSWRVRNTGDAPAAGGHIDRLILSADGVVDANDLVLAEVVRGSGLAVGDSYTASVEVRVTDGRVGDYRLILVTDAGQTVFENFLEGDNSVVSPVVRFAATAAPNLVVDSVSVPPGAVPGETVLVTYVIRNTGESAATAPWVDRIYIDDDTTISGAQQLVSVPRNFDLAPGESYEVKQLVTIPTGYTDGEWRIFVRADAQGQVYEGGRDGDNDGMSGALMLTHPDLVPVLIQGPEGGNAESFSEIEVRWQIRNDGTGSTLGGWTDTVWLSRDDVVGAGDIKLGELIAQAQLAAGAIYDGVLKVTLPIDASGPWRLIVQSDSGGVVAETAAGEANNIGSIALNVGLSDYADLEVSDVAAPAQTIDDPARVRVEWTVTNVGTGAGFTHGWTDRVIVSRDGVLGNNDDIVLGEYVHSGALNVGETYRAGLDLILPAGFHGRYTLFVQSDAKGEVFENGAEANRGVLAGNFDVSPIPWADLVVASVAVPAGAVSGQTIDVTWRITNQ